MTKLSFKTIDLSKHRDLCVDFRRDSYASSFADGPDRFNAENGTDGKDYIDWLRQRIEELPNGCVHVWDGQTIVGQIESRMRDDGTGYVNLFYLVPTARGSGKGRELHDHAIKTFDDMGVRIVRLSVSIENQSAMGFYQHLGWKDLGFRPGRNDTRLFEFDIESKSNDPAR